MIVKTEVDRAVDSDLEIKLQILFQYLYHFLVLILQDRYTLLVKILSHMSVSCIYLAKSP